MKHLRLYMSDAIINAAAQLFIMIGGRFALMCGSTAIVLWVAVIIGYSVLLAHLAKSCVNKGASFGKYVLCVMLPTNINAGAIGCYIIAVNNFSDYLGNYFFGIILVVSTLSITLISVVYNRLALR